jgi:diguanylate cyclase (GGDEF)-like protein
MTPTSLAAYLAEAVGALIIAVVFQRLLRYYKKGYLQHWAWSWIALAVNLVFVTLGLFTNTDLPAVHPWRIAIACIISVSAYLQLGWLVFGTFELQTGRSLEPPVVRRLNVVIVVGGILTALLALTETGVDGVHVFSVVGVHSLVAIVAFTAAAYAAVRTWLASRGLGSLLVFVGFLFRALVQVARWLIVFALPPSVDTSTVFDALAWSDFLLRFVFGIGMIIWLLEEERRTARDAAAEIEHLAYHDALTGLPNRQLFLDRLHMAIHQARRDGHQLAVFFLDLDRFKVINDSLGHSVGDELLKVVARRLTTALREADTVARLGGDEFTILAPHVRHEDDLLIITRKVLDTIQPAIHVKERELYVTTSIGVSLYPADGEDAESLLKNADTAMYRAKTYGGDTFRMYAPAMNAKAIEQLALESSLRKALANGEFDVFYQPIIELATGRIIAMESLLRWRHPELGLLSPGQFIPLAEATGVIVPLGEWVLREACRQTREWHDQGYTQLRAAVNLSVRQLAQPSFETVVAKVLEDTRLPASALELEITESIAMESNEDALTKLRELKRLGVRITIDDFGTGYSSLGALRLFPVDALKIDRSFVHRSLSSADDATLAAAVIALGHSLKLDVIAEGVEKVEQLLFLERQRCDQWQGYLFSRPMPPEECVDMLEANRYARSPAAWGPRGAGTR